MLLAQRAPRPPARPPLPSQRRLFFVAAGLLIAGETIFWTVLAAVQSNSGVADLDAPVHDGLVASRNPLATAILTAVTTVTSPLWMTVIGCVLALAWAVWKREIWRPALLIGAMAATFAVSTLIKHDVGRGRPAASDFLLGPDDALSFPSGHTFGAGVFLCVLSYLLVRGPGHTHDVGARLRGRSRWDAGGRLQPPVPGLSLADGRARLHGPGARRYRDRHPGRRAARQHGSAARAADTGRAGRS